MAKIILDAARIVVNGVDLSNHCSSVEIDDSADDVAVTGFTVGAYDVELTGFKDAVVTATFFQDYGLSSVHAVLRSLYDSGVAFDVAVTPDAALPVSSSNPRFVMTSRMFDYDPLDGLVGDPVDFDVEFRNAGVGLVEETGAGLFPSGGLFPGPSVFPGA